MQNLDETFVERIIEQITRQVLVLIREESEKKGNAPPDKPISAHDYVERVQPVVKA